MKFTNEIKLPLPTDNVFAALTDVERIASCLPGARIEERHGDAYQGAMRIKVGPIVADYRGTLTFAELDNAARRAVLLAAGEETAGQGSAQARIVSSVLDDPDGARVVVETDLQVVGRLAQFGSGAMEKIAKRMFTEFAKNLEALMTGEEDRTNGSGRASPRTSATAGATNRTGDDTASNSGSNEPTAENVPSLDVLSVVAGPLVGWLRTSGKPILIALLIGYLLGKLRGRSFVPANELPTRR